MNKFIFKTIYQVFFGVVAFFERKQEHWYLFFIFWS